jgi:hypothetical protein
MFLKAARLRRCELSIQARLSAGQMFVCENGVNRAPRRSVIETPI